MPEVKVHIYLNGTKKTEKVEQLTRLSEEINVGELKMDHGYKTSSSSINFAG